MSAAHQRSCASLSIMNREGGAVLYRFRSGPAAPPRARVRRFWGVGVKGLTHRQCAHFRERTR